MKVTVVLFQSQLLSFRIPPLGVWPRWWFRVTIVIYRLQVLRPEKTTEGFQFCVMTMWSYHLLHTALKANGLTALCTPIKSSLAAFLLNDFPVWFQDPSFPPSLPSSLPPYLFPFLYLFLSSLLQHLLYLRPVVSKLLLKYFGAANPIFIFICLKPMYLYNFHTGIYVIKHTQKVDIKNKGRYVLIFSTRIPNRQSCISLQHFEDVS